MAGYDLTIQKNANSRSFELNTMGKMMSFKLFTHCFILCLFSKAQLITKTSSFLTF